MFILTNTVELFPIDNTEFCEILRSSVANIAFTSWITVSICSSEKHLKSVVHEVLMQFEGSMKSCILNTPRVNVDWNEDLYPTLDLITKLRHAIFLFPMEASCALL